MNKERFLGLIGQIENSAIKDCLKPRYRKDEKAMTFRRRTNFPNYNCNAMSTIRRKERIHAQTPTLISKLANNNQGHQH